MLKYHDLKSLFSTYYVSEYACGSYSFFVLANNQGRSQETWSSVVESAMGQEWDFDIESEKIKGRRDVERSFYLETPKNMKIATDNREVEKNRWVDKVPRKKQWD